LGTCPLLVLPSSFVFFERYLALSKMCLQKKELESQESENPAGEKKPAGEKLRVVRNFNQKKPVVDGMKSNVATLSHDVLAGVSLPILLSHHVAHASELYS
jgi:hypothetical protein